MPILYIAKSKRTGKTLVIQPHKSWVINSLRKRHINLSKVRIVKVIVSNKEYKKRYRR
ncbi:MAG: hypothetical protein ACTSWZ_02730 [Candidatus Heimdallarchaeaceae archaeon]